MRQECIDYMKKLYGEAHSNNALASAILATGCVLKKADIRDTSLPDRIKDERDCHFIIPSIDPVLSAILTIGSMNTNRSQDDLYNNLKGMPYSTFASAVLVSTETNSRLNMSYIMRSFNVAYYNLRTHSIMSLSEAYTDNGTAKRSEIICRGHQEYQDAAALLTAGKAIDGTTLTALCSYYFKCHTTPIAAAVTAITATVSNLSVEMISEYQSEYRFGAEAASILTLGAHVLDASISKYKVADPGKKKKHPRSAEWQSSNKEHHASN